MKTLEILTNVLRATKQIFIFSSGNMNNSHPAIAVGATVRAVYENVPAAAGQPGNLEFKGEVIAYDPKKVLVLSKSQYKATLGILSSTVVSQQMLYRSICREQL